MTPPVRKIDPGPALLTPDEELELLALISMTDIEEAKADSKRNMGRIGAALLLAAALGTRGARYTWNPDAGAAGRYRDTQAGRYVPNKQVRTQLDNYLTKTHVTARDLARQLREGRISLAEWEVQMRGVIKRTHLNAIALERGGWSHMNQSAYGRAGQIIRGEYGYLRQFAAELADGTWPMDGRFDQRAQLYSYAGRTSWYESKHANLKAEITHVRSVRNARDSCRQCIELDGKWFKLGDPAYVLPGRRICLRNCLCYEEFGAMGDDESISGIEVA